MPRRPSDETAKAIRLGFPVRSCCCDGMSRHHGTPLAVFNTTSRCLYHRPMFPHRDSRGCRKQSTFFRPIILPSRTLTAATPTSNAIHSDSNWTRREQIELDGLKYDICVVGRKGEFVGVWMCQECGEHGASNHKTSTADQASTRALIDLCVHHNLVHRRLRKPK